MTTASNQGPAGIKQIVKEFSLVSVAKIIALGSLFLCGIIVARSTGPVEFGYYSAALSFIILFDALVGQPLDNAVIRFSSHHIQNNKRVEKVQGYVFRIKLLIALTICIITYWYSDSLTHLIFDESAPQTLVMTIVISGVMLLTTRSTACHLQINQRFTDYAKLDGLQGFFRLVIVGLLFIIGVNSATIYAAIYGLGSFCTFVIYLKLIKQPFFFAAAPHKADKKKIISYIGVTSFIVILSTITGRTDIPLLSALSSADETGFYSAAMQIAMLGTLMASYMAVVFHPKVVEMSKQGKLAGLIKINLWIALLLSLLSIPIALYITPIFIPLVFGEQFQPSVIILQILFIGICADFVIMPILLPVALQLLANKILLGELVITLIFFAAILIIPSIDAVSMAILVSIIRLLKMFLYLFTTVHYLKFTARFSSKLRNT